MAAHRPSDIAAQRQAVLEHAVGIAEKLDHVDADDSGGSALLLLAHRAGLLGLQAVDAGLAARRQAVGDPLSLRGPSRDRGGRAVLEVVGMRHERERCGPRFVSGLQGFRHCPTVLTYARAMADERLDITALIMDDHEWLRHQFARLDDAASDNELAVIWDPLAIRLDTHAQAEETIFYPALLKRGDDAEDETDDAIRDHNKIRDAVAEAGRHAVGTDAWFQAVGHARAENSEHLAEEEDEGLPDFRKNASWEMRSRLGELWVQFYATHPQGKGIDPSDRDPEQYLDEHS